jgi:hypothetical protein
LKIYSIKIVPERVIQRGDANKDGTVDAKDVVRIVEIILGN